MAIDPKRRKEIAEITDALQDAFFSMADQLADRISDALGDGAEEFSQEYFNNIEKNYKRVARFSDNLVQNQDKMIAGTLKQKDIEKQRGIQLGRLRVTQAAYEKFLARARNEGNKEQEKFFKKRLGELEENKKLVNTSYDTQKKQLDVVEKVTSNYQKQGEFLEKIPIFGEYLSQPFKDAADAARRLRLENEGMDESAIFKQANLTLLKGIKDNLVEAAGVTFPLYMFSVMLDQFKQLDSATTEMARNLGTARGSASAFRKEGEGTRGYVHQLELAAHSSDLLRENLVEAFSAFQQGIGIAGYFDENDLRVSAEITKFMGLTAEQAGNLQMMVDTTGKSFSNFRTAVAQSVIEFNQTSGTAVQLSDVMKDIEGLSTDTLLNLRRNPDLLVKAAGNARKLGLNFAALESSAEALTDFESSITAELEAEVLTGRQLNLDKARYLALIGDTVGFQEELTKQVGTLADYEAMIPMQRAAYAKSLGMSSDEMGKMLLRQEAVLANEEAAKALSDEQLVNAQSLVDRGKAANLGEALTILQQQLTAAENFDLAMGKIKESLSSILNTVAPVIDYIGDIFQGISKSKIATRVLAIAAGGFAIGSILSTAKRLLGYPQPVVVVGGGGAGSLMGPRGPMGSGVPFTGPMGPEGMGFSAFTQPGSRGMGVFGQAGKYAKYGKFIKGGGILAGIGVAMDAVNNAADDSLSTGQKIGKTLDQNKFGAAGAALGALFGGVGAIPGFMIGSLLDNLLGDKALIGKYDDFIIPSNGKPMRYNKGDLVMGGTKLNSALGLNNGEGSGFARLEAYMKQLVDEVKTPRPVQFDTRKVGTAFAMANYKS